VREELGETRVFKHKLTAYKKSFPGKFNDLNWSELDGDNIEEIEELYNKVMLTLNHSYQKSARMVGVAYQTAMSGLEGAAKMTGGLVLLDGLSVATAKNEEIKDIFRQINIETGCYESVQSPKLRLVMATLNTAVQVHLLNTQLRSNPELVERLRQQQQAPPVQNLRDQWCSILFPAPLNKFFCSYIVCNGFAMGLQWASGGHENPMKHREFGGVYFNLKGWSWPEHR